MPARLLRVLIFFVAAASPCFGQFWEKPGGPYSGVVQAVHVLDDGAILAGTPGGLYFRPPGSADWTKLDAPAGAIHEIIATPMGLLAATQAGVYASENGRDWEPSGLQVRRVRSVLLRSDGTLFAGTQSRGVFRRAAGDTAWVDASSGLPSVEQQAESYHPITSLAEGADGVLFAGTGSAGMLGLGAGLFKLNHGATAWESTGAPAVGRIGQVIADDEGRVLVAGVRTFWQLEPGIIRSVNNGESWSRRLKIDAAALHRAADGTFYAGTAGGVYRSTSNGFAWEQTALTGQWISSITSMPDGTLLAGSGHHCYDTYDPPPDCRFSNGLFASHDVGDSWRQIGVQPAAIHDLHVLAGETLWVATETGVLQSTDRGDRWTGVITSFQPALVLYEDEQSVIYAGTGHWGVVPLSNRDYVELPVLGSVTAMTRWGDGSWVAGLAEGIYSEAPAIYRMEEGAFPGHRSNLFKQGTEFVSILRMEDETLLAAMRKNFRGWYEGGDHGIVRSTDDGETWHTASDGLPEGDVHDLLMDEAGRVYAATGHGVYRLREDESGWMATALDAGNVRSLMTAEGGILAMRTDGLFGLREGGGIATEQAPFDEAEGVRLAAVDSAGHVYVAAERGLFRSTAPVAVSRDRSEELPRTFGIVSVYPNPFRSETTIEYTLATGGAVRVVVHDVLGREVAVPLSGMRAAGTHRAVWQAPDLAPGLYFLRIEAGGQSVARAVLLAR